MLHQILAKIVKESMAYNFGCRALYNLPWRASVNSHQVQSNIPILTPYCEKICTTSLKDAEILTTCGFVLWCSRLFIFVLVVWTLQPHFTLWLSARTLQCFFVCGCVHATILPYFTWPWPGLDSVSYSVCSVALSVTG